MAPNDYDDLLKYPILTEELDEGSFQDEGGRRGAFGDNASTVRSAIRKILGWQPRREDTRGFVSALNQSFKSVEVDGYTHWKWTPHSFTIDAGLGEVTGAQASLYQQAQVVLREVTPILDRLKPLITDSDPEDIYATLSIVRTTLDSLVSELGAVGGPVVPKVDDDFHTLLNYNPASGELPDLQPETVGGRLGELRDRLGLDTLQVNTIEEEQMLTNFIILLNYIGLLLRSWVAQRQFFTSGSEVFLGTQLVKLSRILNVLSESVDQLRFALRSVFLGEADQQTITLHLDDGDTDEDDVEQITISELLDWVDQSVTVKWPYLLREGGKDGAASIVPSLRRLVGIVGAALDLSKNRPDPDSDDPNADLPAGFFTARVQMALQELQANLATARRLANEVNRVQPRARQFLPHAGFQGETVMMSIVGTNFEDGAAVTLVENNGSNVIEASDVIYVGPQQLVAQFDLEYDDPPGDYSLFITNPGGGRCFLETFTIQYGYGYSKSGRSAGGPGDFAGSTSGGPGDSGPATSPETETGSGRSSSEVVDVVDVILTVTVPADTPAGRVFLVCDVKEMQSKYPRHTMTNQEKTALELSPLPGLDNVYVLHFDIAREQTLKYHYAFIGEEGESVEVEESGKFISDREFSASDLSASHVRLSDRVQSWKKKTTGIRL